MQCGYSQGRVNTFEMNNEMPDVITVAISPRKMHRTDSHGPLALTTLSRVRSPLGLSLLFSLRIRFGLSPGPPQPQGCRHCCIMLLPSPAVSPFVHDAPSQSLNRCHCRDASLSTVIACHWYSFMMHRARLLARCPS